MKCPNCGGNVSSVYIETISENNTDDPMYSGNLIDIELVNCLGECGENAIDYIDQRLSNDDEF